MKRAGRDMILLFLSGRRGAPDREGAAGAWLYELRCTTESPQAYAIRMFYLGLGQVNRLLRLDPELLFQIARWVFGYSALYALFGLMQRVFRGRRRVWLGFLLAALGSGPGYIQLMVGWLPGAQTPVDLWFIDGYILFSLALFPHFAFTLALMCAALAIFVDALRSAQCRGTVGCCSPSRCWCSS